MIGVKRQRQVDAPLRLGSCMALSQTFISNPITVAVRPMRAAGSSCLEEFLCLPPILMITAVPVWSGESHDAWIRRQRRRDPFPSAPVPWWYETALP